MPIKITDGEKIIFDQKIINIKEELLLFLDEKNFDNFIKKNTLPICYKKLYDFTRTENFIKNYKKLLKILSKKFDTKNFYYQKIPSFRIHKASSKSVEYHNDGMYGHGKDVINVWVPMTNTNKENSLWISNKKKSIQLMDLFKKKKMNIKDANKIFKKFSSPQIMKYGEILFFHTLTMHGTKKNTSSVNRISFDFRILEKGKSSGIKSLNDMFQSYFKKKIRHKESIFFMYQRNPLMENCSHSIQREILSFYAKKNLFYNIIEETEIHGVDHYPNLKFYILNSTIKDILISSILCLPKDKNLRLKLLNLAKKNNKILHFALENVTTKVSTYWINNYYSSVLSKFN